MDGTDCAWSIGDLLPLLAGLKLDRLTVMDAFHDPGIKVGSIILYCLSLLTFDPEGWFWRSKHTYPN